MLFALAIGLFVLSVIAHEFGHAIVMHRYGIALKEAGIGLPWGPHITLPKKWFAWVGKNFELHIYLLLLGAYVKQEEEAAVDALPYEKRTHVYGAGIIANFLFTIGCIVLFAITYGASGMLDFGSDIPPVVWISLGGMAFAVVLCFFARKICAYLFPIATILVLYLLVRFFWGASGEQVLNSSGGVITIGQLAGKATGDIAQVIVFGGFISLMFGISNLLPIYPADGGNIILAILERWLPMVVGVFKRLGGAVLMLLLGLMLLGDAYHLFVPL